MSTPRSPSSSDGFLTTRWSVVVQAGQVSTPESKDALSVLAESYWYPLYAYLRRKGVGPDEAHDLVQGFFTQLFERRDLERLAPERGRFRAWLLASLKHFHANHREREGALKRGGDRVHVSIDADDAAQRWSTEPSHEVTPDKQFEQSWARSVLEQAMERLEAQYSDQGRRALFERLAGHLSGDPDLPSHAEVAAELGMTEGAVKVATHRLRQRYGAALRAEISQTLTRPQDLDDEVQHLLECLG